jgi:aspartate/methionine/tyrosine aminotransferase
LAFAKFLEHFFSVSNINIENLLIGNGGTGILEMISFSLLNSGDKMLIPAPYYSGFDLDFNTRFGVELVPWQIKNSDFDFSQKLIDEIASGKYRAFMLNNPHNPLAQNFSEQMVKTIAQTCIAHNVHLISDEVYAHSIVNPGRPFHSVIPYMGPKNPVHFVYSVAKDFGLSGFKTGFFYSEHRASVQAMKNVSYFYPVSNYTQKLLEFIFEDLAWIELLKQHNQELLGQAYQHLRTYVLDPLNAAHNSVEQGIFAYVDLTQLASKIKAPNAEIFYDRLLNEIKTNMTPGIYFHDNHPWRFRVCFAKPQSHIQELGRRLRHWS